LEVRVCDSGPRDVLVQGLGFTVEGLGVSVLEVRVCDFGRRDQNVGLEFRV
jgi:hypothetical protein